MIYISKALGLMVLPKDATKMGLLKAFPGLDLIDWADMDKEGIIKH